MRNFDGYPTSFGNQRAAVFPHQGPASYTQVTAGTAPALSTGGDTVTAKECGLKYIDFAIAGLSDSGTYRVEVVYDSVSGVVTSNSPAASQGATSVRLRWTVVATGAQAAGSADLDAEIVRLMVFGPK